MSIELRRLSLVAVVAATLGLPACGSEDEPASEGSGSGPETGGGSSYGGGGEPRGGTTRLSLSAEERGGFTFDKESLRAKPGAVTVTMDNPRGNQAPHTVAIEGSGVDEAGEVVQPGSEATVTAEVEAGEYTFYCPVGNHRQQGMEGTLTVR